MEAKPWMPDPGEWRQSRQEEPHPGTRDQDVRRKVGHHIRTSGGRGTEYQFPSWEKTNEGGQMVGIGRRPPLLQRGCHMEAESLERRPSATRRGWAKSEPLGEEPGEEVHTGGAAEERYVVAR